MGEGERVGDEYVPLVVVCEEGRIVAENDERGGRRGRLNLCSESGFKGV